MEWTVLHAGQGLALAAAAAAAVTDSRTGLIPNWLTLPAIAVAPVLYGAAAGVRGLLVTVAAIFLCGLVPYLLFRRGAAGGGDVKLLAAIGGLTGISMGLSAQLFALFSASLFALGILVWRGRLRRALLSSLTVLVNGLRPRRKRRPVQLEGMMSLRLGPFVLLGTVLAVLEELQRGSTF